MNVPGADTNIVTTGDLLVRQVKKTIDVHQLVCPGQSVLIGLSGGADSVALLYVLKALAPDQGLRLGVAHGHHGLRGKQADLDADFAAALARNMDLPYYVSDLDVRGRSRREKISLEEAGRKERYAFFSGIAEAGGYDKIAVGHQKNDAAEQILLNLLRGSGPDGMGGIAPLRGRIIRPLIRVSRMQIESFLEEKQIAWRVDSSNADNRFTRNLIRNRLLPEIEAVNPQITEALFRIGEIMRAENAWINDLVTPVFEKAVLERGSRHLVLCAKSLAAQPEAATRRLLRRALGEIKGDLRRISWKHVEQILSCLGRTGGGSRQVHLPARIRVICNPERIFLAREKKSLRSDPLSGRQYETAAFAYRLEADGLKSGSACVWIPEIQAWLCFQCTKKKGNTGDCKSHSATAWMDLSKITFPLTIRNARPGDRFVPLGMRGTTKIKDFFINRKIPRHERSRVPLVQSPQGIVWVGGMRIADGVKITETTTDILKIEISGKPANPQHSIDFRKDF